MVKASFDFEAYSCSIEIYFSYSFNFYSDFFYNI